MRRSSSRPRQGSYVEVLIPYKRGISRRAGVTLLLLMLVLSLMLSACGGGSNSPSISVPPPQGAFFLAATPSNLRVGQNAGGASTVSITPQTGFSGTVNLTASNLPNGVTATFSPSSTSSTSTLTFIASGGASLGTVNVTITGFSNDATETATLSLTIFAPPPANSVPATFFALNNVNPGDNPATDGMSYGAIGHPIRLAWPYIETSRGVYDFSLYDQYVAIAPREGPNGIVADLDLTLGMTPSWAVSDQSTCRSAPNNTVICQAPPDNIADWQAFITALVNHYNGSSASRPYIKYYEIWNEWNVVDASNGFWSGSVQQLVNLEQAACTIIHAQALNFSFVLTPSTVGPATTSNKSAPQALQQFFTAGGSACIDGVSFHGNLGLMSLNPFPLPGEGCQQSGCNGTIVQITDSYRQIMYQNGLAATIPLLDTEGGFESANITDSDQRAAWLAQFYALQGGLFNSDQLQWVSWFTWGAPGVAGNIETANQTPDTAGVAYNQLYNWLIGRLPSPCAQSGMIWTCGLTGSANYQAEIIWDDSQTCVNGNCTTSSQQVPSWVTNARDLAGNQVAITNSTVPVGLKPIIVENQ